MKTVSAARIAAHFDEYLTASRDEPLLVTRKGKPVAVLIAVQKKQDAEQLTVDGSRTLRSIFEQAHQQLERGEAIGHDEFWQRLEQSRSGKRRVSRTAKKPSRSR